jgi:hypothetical protein
VMVKAGGKIRVYVERNRCLPVSILDSSAVCGGAERNTFRPQEEISHPETHLGQNGVTRLHQNRE